MQQFLTSLEEITRNPPRRILLLYSGGLDGTYFLHQLRELGISVIALNVCIGEPETSRMAETHAGVLGVPYQEVDVTGQFFSEFLPAAVHADACYQEQYPVSSTITRPLMARAAVETARELGCDAIGHTATYMQNSAMRLSGSVSALAPDLAVASPFLGSDLPRSKKLGALRSLTITFPEGIHSIDSNPWARVIECGSLENPENYLDESVFKWTRSVNDAPGDPAEVSLTFDSGLPTRVNGVPLPLETIVTDLNALGGEHGIGRSSGLEDTPFMVKNHEVREAPAATVIIKAHQVLANAVFTAREHNVRGLIGREWTAAVVQGGWFTHLGESLARSLADLDRPLDGTVRLRLHKGSLTVLSVKSPNGLYYARLGETFHDSMAGYAYAPWLSMSTWPDRLRMSGTTKRHE